MKTFFIYVCCLLGSLNVSAESLVVVNKSLGTASLIDVASGKSNEYTVGYLPHEVAVSGRKAYISNYGHQHVRSSSLSNRPGNTLTILDFTQNTKPIEVNLGQGKCAPHGIAASSDGKEVYVTCEGRQEVAVIEGESGQLKRLLRTNQPGSHLLVKDSGSRLYVTNFWIGTVTVINTDSGEIVGQIFTGRTTEGISLSPDEQWLYVTVVETNELIRISTKSLKVITRVQLPEGTSPIRIAVTHDGSEVIVNQAVKNSLGFFDAETLEPLAEVALGDQPIGLAISHKLHRSYSANMNSGTVTVVDLKSRKVIKTLKVGDGSPDGLAVIEGGLE